MAVYAPSNRYSSGSESSGYLAGAMSRQGTISSRDGNRSIRQSKRLSTTAFYMSVSAKDKDVEIDDELARAQNALRDLKQKISTQSKKNFLFEKDVRYLDARIALLIQNRLRIEEQNEFASHFEEPADMQSGAFPNDDKTHKYGNLFFLLQSEPRHIAHLCRLISMSNIDNLLQTVMFTFYGNQYEAREENLLLTMFQSVLTHQFDSTAEYSSLLRQNTPASRMMMAYTRRPPGKEYLKAVLADKINSLIEHKDLELEINPLKVYETLLSQETDPDGPNAMPRGITGDEAAARADVQEIIEPRVQGLIGVANSFLDTIIAGLEEIPYGIRWICKQIRSLSRRKYPDASNETICTLIGGFFFLRFINPAIISPASYMVIDSTPAENPRRTLTYVAKMLQNLANKPTTQKEDYMTAVLQPFTQQNRERMSAFLLEICEVQDFYESLELDNYVALSKKDLELKITLNEVYSMHEMLQEHQDQLVRDGNPHLGTLLSELGPPPPQLPRKDNREIILPLYSKWEMPLDDLSAALDITPAEVLFMEAKSTFVLIMRSLPTDSPARRKPLRLINVAQAAATMKNDLMVRKGIRAMELLSQLQDMRVVTKDDGFGALRAEVEQEMDHLGNVKDKALTDYRKLLEVSNTIRDHNRYLTKQLATYKDYLNNVRNQAAGRPVEKKESGRKLDKDGKAMEVVHKFTHAQLDKEGVIMGSKVPENRRQGIFFTFSSRSPGTFLITLNYKGRAKSLLELDLKLDDLLEMEKENQLALDLEYATFSVPKLLALLNKKFARKKGW